LAASEDSQAHTSKSVPQFCTDLALRELAILNIQSHVAWDSLLRETPKGARRTLWFALSADQGGRSERSGLVCALSFPDVVRTVANLTPRNKLRVRYHLTVNGVFNDWPDNRGRLTESIQSIERVQLMDECTRQLSSTLDTIRAGILVQRGYIDASALADISGEPHLLSRFGNMLSRIRRAEEWYKAVDQSKKSHRECSLSDWLREVGYWPIYDPRTS
jgi:hypothetical protein